MKISTLTPSKVRGEGLIGYRHLDGLREQRLIAYDNAKGRHYLKRRGEARAERQPVNLTQQQWRTLIPFLAMNAPLSDVSPQRAGMEFEAKLRKVLYDKQAERLRLDELYQDAATEAVFSGLAFTLNGVKNGGEFYTAGNRRIDMGQEFTRLLDLDDVALDSMAKTIQGMRFFAHRYAVSREEAIDAIEDGVYGAIESDYDDGILPNPNIASPDEAFDILSQMEALESYGRRSLRVDDNDGERVVSGERIDETILLWDFIFYMHGETWIVTVPASPGAADPFPAGAVDKFLACYKWRGKASGPVNCLTFLRVPFNKIPVALEQMQRDLAEISDLVANKIVRQILRTKNVVVYAPSSEDMAMTMRKGSEGQYIRGNPNGIKTVQDGGLIPDMMPGAQFFSDQWQNATGNLAMAAGSGDLGKTATAFEGLMGRIQGFLDFLRKRVEQLATDDLQNRHWSLSNNPAFTEMVSMPIGQPPQQQRVDVMVAAQGSDAAQVADHILSGDPEDFGTKVRAYSMQYTNPAISAQQITHVIQEVLPVIIQEASMGALDARACVQLLARKLNEPELENLIPDPLIQIGQMQATQALPGLDQDPSGMAGQPQNQPGGRRPGNRQQPGQPVDRMRHGAQPRPQMQGMMQSARAQRGPMAMRGQRPNPAMAGAGGMQ